MTNDLDLALAFLQLAYQMQRGAGSCGLSKESKPPRALLVWTSDKTAASANCLMARPCEYVAFPIFRIVLRFGKRLGIASNNSKANTTTPSCASASDRAGCRTACGSQIPFMLQDTLVVCSANLGARPIQRNGDGRDHNRGFYYLDSRRRKNAAGDRHHDRSVCGLWIRPYTSD